MKGIDNVRIGKTTSGKGNRYYTRLEKKHTKKKH